MRNLITFIWKYNFTFIFLFLELIAFGLLIQTNRFHQASFYAWANSVSGGVFSAKDNISNYFKLKKINEDLSEEVALLRSHQKDSYIKLRAPHVYIKDTLYTQQYRYLGAKAINNTTHKRSNYIVLNQGKEQGIYPDMGVVTRGGVVGIVKDVSDHFCTVISVLHSQTKISAKVKKNNYFGILVWDGGDPALGTVKNIPNHVQLQKGDTIVTMGSSTIFPAGIPIGVVEEFNTVDGDDFAETRIRFTANFSNLSYVYIIKNLLKEEQQQLEKESQDVE